MALLLTFLLIITGCNEVKVEKIKDDIKTDSIRFYEDYKSVSKDNIYEYATYYNILNSINNKTEIIYLGFPTSPWCKELVPILNEVAKENNIKRILYYNFKEIRASNAKEYQELVALLNDYIKVYDDEEKQIYAPSVIFVKDGKIIKVHEGTLSSHNAIERKMTEEEITELKNILFSYIKLMNETENTEKDN